MPRELEPRAQRPTGVIGTPNVDILTHSERAFHPRLEGGKQPFATPEAAIRHIIRSRIAYPLEEVASSPAGNTTNVSNAFDILRRPNDGAVIPVITVGRDGHTETLRNAPVFRDAQITEYDGPNAVGIIVTSEANTDRTIASIKPEEIPGGFNYEGPTLGAIYLTSVGGKDWSKTYAQVTDYKRLHGADTLLAVSPGSLQLAEKGPELYDAIKQADILLGNKEEALDLIGEGPNSHLSMHEILIRTQELGANLVYVTDGKEGAYAIEGNTVYHMPPFAPKELQTKPHKNTLGAGDSASAAFAKAILEGLPVREAMRRAAFNPSSVIREEDAHSGQLDYIAMEDLSANHPEFQPTVTILKTDVFFAGAQA